ncbi:alpha/beta hydrolase [Streptomyces sp. ASQP_92]|uniref:alpha/beta hydrolase n=1 Tax=Streptomyces sp. ASQP_92 TaxID=2979116 RepID=UPI0021C09AE2|nr:alpha/beta hydrolase [Streptomyces sp. ASQP_92]MCT9094257.1 alpha/beta hydrolase [Streptomyces sp. ASQP_92]
MTLNVPVAGPEELLRFSFVQGDETIECVSSEPRRPASRTAVLLHGAGTASMERLLPLAADLAAAGARTVALDFAGHGSSSGRLDQQSLEKRHAQAAELIRRFVDPDDELVLVGFSMSGQTVADLLGDLADRVTHLCLCAPAAYAADAWRVPFGDGFTERIRRPGSWRESEAFGAYAAFRGRSVLMVPGHDAVIPEGVTAGLREALRARADLTEIVLHGASHQIGLALAQRGDTRRMLAALLTS